MRISLLPLLLEAPVLGARFRRATGAAAAAATADAA
jgi:hypothetical protein